MRDTILSSVAMASAAALALAAFPALAQEGPPVEGPGDSPAPVEQAILLNAETPKVCQMGETSATQVALGVMAQTSGAGVGRLRTDIGEQVVTVAAWCNTSSAINVTAQAMLGPTFGDTLSTAVFARAVNFRARATGWTEDAAAPAATSNADRLGGGDVSLTSDDSLVSGPNEANLSIRLDTFAAPANSLLISGDYQGAVIVTLTPQ